MKSYLILPILLLLIFSVQKSNGQCDANNVAYTVQQPTASGGTGTITFSAQQSGYYIMNTRDYGNQVPLFTGASWPGIAGKYAFSNLAVGSYTFVLLRPATAPSNPANPNLSDDYYCTQYIIDIKVTPPTAFTVTTSNSTNCSSTDGKITISGLPGTSVYGIKFPTQSNFTQTNGASSVTSPNGLILAAGNYSVIVTTDVNNINAIKYKLPAKIESATGSCSSSAAAFSAVASNLSDCNSTNGIINVSGLPNNVNFGIKFPTETSFTQTNGTSSFSSPSWYNLKAGFYSVELTETFNNAAARKYLLPVEIKSNSGSCPFPYTASVTNASNCTATNGTITISNLPQYQGYGVLFPGQTAYVSTSGAATSITSSAVYAPGRHLVQVRQGGWSTAPCVFTFVTVASASGACSAPTFSVSGTNSTDCSSQDGTITVSGFPLNSYLYGVKFPNFPGYIQINPGATSISSPVGANIAPGTYNVIVTENVFSSSAVTYPLPITIGSNSGSCPAPVPTFSTVTTNATSCVSTDGRISVLGFIPGQNYGVKFPNQLNYMLVADGESTITSPAGLSIPAGTYKINITSNVYDLFSEKSIIQVTVGSNTGTCIVPTPGFNEYPECSSNEITVYNETFGGSGTNVNNNYNGNLPAGYVTDYTSIASACSEPGDGKLAIINTTDMTGRSCNANKIFGNIQVTSDHTGNLGGAFVFVNGSYNPGRVFEKTITGLCAGSLYTFSIWVKDLAPYVYGNIYNFKPIPPALAFYINGTLADNDTLAVSNLVEPNSTSWVKVGFQFYANNSGTATLAIRNDAPGGVGNDFAIDDITLSKCEPKIKLNADMFCNGSYATINSTITGGTLANTRYRWYKNNTPVTSWTTNPSYMTNVFAINDKFYVEVAEATNNTDANCIYRSDTLKVIHVVNGCFVLPNDNLQVNINNSNDLYFINWIYNYNKDIRYYEIQQNISGNNFETIKIVNATGSDEHKYITDITTYLKPGMNYFRLLAITKEGKQEVSSVSMVKNNSKQFFAHLNENPVINKASITINSSYKQIATISVVDALGRIMFYQNFTLNQGINNIDLFKSNGIKKGNYFIKINTSTQNEVLKLLITN